MFRVGALALIASLALSGCDALGDAGSRDQIRVVGSSTVYPFSTSVAEQFRNKNPQFKSPIIESTGTGAGMKLFCAGLGARYPDVANASRQIKASEYESCRKNGVKDIVEIQIGLDGVAFAESVKGMKLPLTIADIYRALAAKPFGKAQTAKTWKDINPALPAEPIRVYGPPSTSGTRDALAELIMTRGCDSDDAMRALKESDPDAHKKICTTVREDGAYIDAGENDNLIAQKLSADPKAIGIFGFGSVEENADKLSANTVNGVTPTYATISDFSYPGARPLYIYVKKQHIRAIAGLKEFVGEFASAWGADGYLKRRGMVIAPANVQAESARIVANMTPLDPATLK
ncbi:MAG: substrate-binding domain-containing protein [Sphingomonadales bacterium]